MARGRWLLHVLAAVALALNAMLGGTGGSMPARTTAQAAPAPPGPALGAVTLTAADPAHPNLRYRLVNGASGPIVETSSDGGARWAVVVTPGAALQSPAAVAAALPCAPARYVAIRALTPVSAGAASSIAPAPHLYIATAGTIGDYLDRGCSSARGGLFALQPNGAVTPLGTAGLPYDQDPVGRTIRAYDVDMVTPDPRQPATMLYVHASQGTGPNSPPEGLYKSSDGGAHWAEIDSGIRPSAVITNTVGMRVPVYGPGTLTIAPANPRHLTWATGTGAYVSVDAGAHWQLTSGNAPAPPPAPALATPRAQLHGIRTRGAAVASAPRPAVAGPLALGLDEGWTVQGGQPLVTPGQIANTQLAGAAYVRVNFRLGGAQNWSDQATLNAYDTVVNNFLAAGIQVLGLVTQEATRGYSQSDWTANNYENTGGNGDNSFLESAYVQNALVPLIRHFHDRVTLWELWNEPNGYASCNGTVCTGHAYIYPSNFAALLADAYGAIKGAYPGVTLISGGLFGHDIGGVLSPTNAGATYLANTFTMGTSVTGTWLPFMGAGGAFPYPLDGVGQHLYLDQGGLTSSDHISTYYTWVHQAPLPFVTPVPDTAALPPTYMTEGAWTTASVSQDIQAQNLDILFNTTRAMGYVPDATWFELNDNPPGNQYYGLIDRYGNYKESFGHYQAQAAMGAATSTPTATTMPSATASPSPTPTASPAVTATPTATAAGTGTTPAQVSLNAGWNLISLPLAPAPGPLTAVALLNAVLQNGGGHLAALYSLTNNQWAPSVILSGGKQIGSDFPLQVGVGYLLYTDLSAQYTETGTVPANPVPWTLNAGWNLVGLPPNAPAPLTAWTVLDGIQASSPGSTLNAIYGLANNQWSPSLVDRNGAPSASDFPLQPGQGYLLYVQQAITYVPGAARRRSASSPTPGAPGAAQPPSAPALPAPGS